MSPYELAILGSATRDERQRLTTALSGLIEDFGLVLGEDVLLHDGATVPARDKRAAFAAASSAALT